MTVAAASAARLGSIRPGGTRLGAQLAGLATVIALWQLAAIAAGGTVLPGPLDTFPVFVDLVTTGRFAEPLAGSVQRTFLGFVLAFAVGLAYGLAAGRSERFAHVSSLTFQVVLFANTLIVVLWGLAILGHTNSWAVVLITGFVVSPTIAIYMRDVIKTVDKDILEMAAAHKTTRLGLIRDVYLPFLTPSMLSSARIGLSQSWKTVMLCEVFGFPEGIGWMIRQAYSGYNIRAVIAWLLVFIIALLIAERLIRLIEHRTVRWQ